MRRNGPRAEPSASRSTSASRTSSCGRPPHQQPPIPTRVNPQTTTGQRNRWMTQLGAPVLGLSDRAAMDRLMLTYTTPALEADVQIAGTATLTIHLSSDHTDGTLLAYLEDVDPKGRSRYLTEGGLRLIHRRTTTNPAFPQTTPYHSFARGDAQPLEPGKRYTIEFKLWPIAALIRKGHRLRLALAGADAGTFDPVPATGLPTLTVHHGATTASALVIPIVKGGLSRK